MRLWRPLSFLHFAGPTRVLAAALAAGVVASAAHGEAVDAALLGPSTFKLLLKGGTKHRQAVVSASAQCTWLILSGRDAAPAVSQFGEPGDIPVPADYDGDGIAELAVFRPQEGAWYILHPESGVQRRVFGLPNAGLIPVPGDYDGNGTADRAVFNPQARSWAIQKADGFSRIQDYPDEGPIPVPGDYYGDGTWDPATYDPATARWILRSGLLAREVIIWGPTGAVPVPADYDGNGKTDLAVFEPDSGRWSIREVDGSTRTVAFVAPGLTPIPIDLGGDGRFEPAAFDAARREWLTTRDGLLSVHPWLHTLNPRPVPQDYDGDGAWDLALFHANTQGETQGISVIPLTLRRLHGESPREIRLRAVLHDPNTAKFVPWVPQPVHTLGRAPSYSTGDTQGESPYFGWFGDGDVDEADLARLDALYTGDGVSLSQTHYRDGAYFDFDDDLDIDDADRAVLLSQFTPPRNHPWLVHTDVVVGTPPDTPIGERAILAVTAEDTATGESHTIDIPLWNRPFRPFLTLRERPDSNYEVARKLYHGREPLAWDLSVYNRGARRDRIDLFVTPLPGFTFECKPQWGDTSLSGPATPGAVASVHTDPYSGPYYVRLLVHPPADWPEHAEPELTVTAKSAHGGDQWSLRVYPVNAGRLWTESDLLRPGGRHHNVMAGTWTTWSLLISNPGDAARIVWPALEPDASAAGWETRLDAGSVWLNPGESIRRTLQVRAPDDAGPDAAATWKVLVRGMPNLFSEVGTVHVGARVSRQPKVFFVAIDGLNPEYLALNRVGAGAGIQCQWLMPHIRAFMDQATTFTQASACLPAATDPNHIAAMTGSSPGTSGSLGVQALSPMFVRALENRVAQEDPTVNEIAGAALRHGPDGARIQTLFDVADQVMEDHFSAYVTSKGWMTQYVNGPGGGPIDLALTGAMYPPYISRPDWHFAGDPLSDTDPDDPHSAGGLNNILYAPGAAPPDRWTVEAAERIIEMEDPDAMYLLLGLTDAAAHNFGPAWDPAEWRDMGTPSLYDDIHTMNPRGAREEMLDVVREVDEAFGRLLAFLERRGVLEKSYLVLLSDHGQVMHRYVPIDLAGFLESYGYAHMKDLEVFATSSMATLYRMRPEEIARVEALLESDVPISPGRAKRPWYVLNAAEMQSGFDVSTGTRLTGPNEMWSAFYGAFRDEPGGNNPTWPDLILLAREGHQFRITSPDLEPYIPPVRDRWEAGHGSPDSQQILLMMGGPGIPQGKQVDDPVSITDVAPTLYQLLGWPTPDHVDGRPLPGIARQAAAASRLRPNLWINEIRPPADATSGLGLEIAGESWTDLGAYTLSLYDADQGAWLGDLVLDGILPGSPLGFGAIWFEMPLPAQAAGRPLLYALSPHCSRAFQLLGPAPPMLAVDGPAAGMLSIDIGVRPAPGLPQHSLQLSTQAARPEEDLWLGPAPDSPDALNDGQEVPADADGDGIPSSWEWTYYLSPTSADPHEDTDMDGYGNLAEFLTGTDPTDPNSYFRLTLHRQDPAWELSLPLGGADAGTITVESRDNWEDAWTLHTVMGCCEAHGRVEITPAATPNRFYRATATPNPVANPLQLRPRFPAPAADPVPPPE